MEGESASEKAALPLRWVLYAGDPARSAALSAGGEENGAPGERPYGDYYYAAFVLDPDGHNIEAVYHGER